MSPSSYRACKWAPIFVILLCFSGCGRKKKEEAPKLEPQVQVVTAVQEIATPEEFNKLMESGKGIIAKFHATWCPPCLRMRPLFDAVAHKYEGKAHFVSIDVDKPEVRDLVDQFVKEGVPLFVFVDKCGQTVDIHPGGYEEKEFNKIVAEFVEKKC